ncbi:hypothetical protein COP2_042902 [Malus domestica]
MRHQAASCLSLLPEIGPASCCNSFCTNPLQYLHAAPDHGNLPFVVLVRILSEIDEILGGAKQLSKSVLLCSSRQYTSTSSSRRPPFSMSQIGHVGLVGWEGKEEAAGVVGR